MLLNNCLLPCVRRHFAGAQAPACLADQLAALTGGADATKTVVPPETYYYEDVAPIPDFRDAINAPDSALARFTNVVVTDSPVASSPVPASIVADLQGQVSSMGDIVRAALANAEVAAALPVAQRTTLQALAANADFTAAPIPQDIRYAATEGLRLSAANSG